LGPGLFGTLNSSGADDGVPVGFGPCTGHCSPCLARWLSQWEICAMHPQNKITVSSPSVNEWEQKRQILTKIYKNLIGKN
jgi:hypothetical protein